MAQYQADALKTYRDSLAWDSTENSLASFLDAGAGSTGLTAMRDYLPVAATQGAPFCMGFFVQNVTDWHINSNPYCDGFAKTLAQNLNSPTMQITLSAITNDSIKATVTVSYKAANNSAITEKVTNTILLTKTR